MSQLSKKSQIKMDYLKAVSTGVAAQHQKLLDIVERCNDVILAPDAEVDATGQKVLTKAHNCMSQAQDLIVSLGDLWKKCDTLRDHLTEDLAKTPRSELNEEEMKDIKGVYGDYRCTEQEIKELEDSMSDLHEKLDVTSTEED